jgi:hypothetical protein
VAGGLALVVVVALSAFGRTHTRSYAMASSASTALPTINPADSIISVAWRTLGL